MSFSHALTVFRRVNRQDFNTSTPIHPIDKDDYQASTKSEMFDLCIKYIPQLLLSLLGAGLRAPTLSYLEMWVINQRHSLEWRVTWELICFELQLLVIWKFCGVVVDTSKELYHFWGVGNIDYIRLGHTVWRSIFRLPGRYIMGIMVLCMLCIAYSVAVGVHSIPIREHSEWTRLSCENLSEVSVVENVSIFESPVIQSGKLKFPRTSDIRTFEHRCQVAIERIISCYALADDERAGRYRESLDEQMKPWLETSIEAVKKNGYHRSTMVVDALGKESADWIFLFQNKLYCHLPVPSDRTTTPTYKYCQTTFPSCVEMSVGFAPQQADNGSGLSVQHVGSSIIYSKAR